MENLFVVASLIAFFYIIFKFIEMRFLDKQNIPFKVLIKDTLVVFSCVLIGIFIVEQINPTLLGESTVNVTQVFTDNPGF